MGNLLDSIYDTIVKDNKDQDRLDELETKLDALMVLAKIQQKNIVELKNKVAELEIKLALYTD